MTFNRFVESKALTRHQKQLIIKIHRRKKSLSADMTLTFIATWTKNSLSLKTVPSRSTISRVLNNASTQIGTSGLAKHEPVD